MKSVMRHRYGGTEALKMTADQAIPMPASGEVRVAVRTAGIDPGTWHLMTGLPLAARLVLGLRAPRYPGLGLDLAGTVDALGPDVSGFAEGDEVFGIGRGALAEFAIAPAAKLAHRPPSLGVDEAAVLSISGLTALQAVRDAGGLVSGQSVLVLGAAGGVGSYAVQIAVALGGLVTGVASGAKRDSVLGLGAHEFVDYTAGEPIGRWDLIIDTAGNRPVRHLRAMLEPRGTAVLVGAEGGGRVIGGLDRTLRALVVSPFVSQRLQGLVSSENAADLAVLSSMVSSGRLRPFIGERFSFDDVAAAIEYVHSGHATGKTVLRVA